MSNAAQGMGEGADGESGGEGISTAGSDPGRALNGGLVAGAGLGLGLVVAGEAGPVRVPTGTAGPTGYGTPEGW